MTEVCIDTHAHLLISFTWSWSCHYAITTTIVSTRNYHLNEMQQLHLCMLLRDKKCIQVCLSLLISYCTLAIINVPQSHTKDTVSDILVGRIIKSNSSNLHCNYSNFTILLEIWVSQHSFFYLLIPTEENNT